MTQYLDGPIDLFQQEKAHHLMGQCDSSKGNTAICPLTHFFRKAIGTTYNKGKFARSIK